MQATSAETKAELIKQFVQVTLTPQLEKIEQHLKASPTGFIVGNQVILVFIFLFIYDFCLLFI